MRVFRHACQQQAALALANSITIKTVFSHAALAVRISIMNPPTSCAPQPQNTQSTLFLNSFWCLHAV